MRRFINLTVTYLAVLCAFLPTIVRSQAYLAESENSKIKVKPVVAIQAYSFDLKDVRLLDGSPFKNAMDKDAAYLLSIEPNRLLHRFYLNAGLPTNGDVY